MAEKVFISYAYQDREYLKQVVNELQKHGIITESENLISDHANDFKSGSNIRTMLQKRIQEASKIIVLWTEESAISQFVNYEMGMAEAMGKQIIIAVSRKLVPQIPASLADMQIVDIENNCEFINKEELAKLMRKKQESTISKVLGIPHDRTMKNKSSIWKRVKSFFVQKWETGFKLRDLLVDTENIKMRSEIQKNIAQIVKLEAERINIETKELLIKQKEFQGFSKVVDDIFADDGLPDSAKKLKLAKLLEKNPEIEKLFAKGRLIINQPKKAAGSENIE